MIELIAPCAQLLLHGAGGDFQQRGVAAPETVDGLLGVADQEQTAPAGSGGGEFVEQRFQQPPLGRVGVLEFVDQQVVDALIQFVLHPVPVVGVIEQLAGFPFQVGEVDQPALALDALKVVEQACACAVPGRGQRQRCVPRHLIAVRLQRGAQFGVQIEEAMLTLGAHLLPLDRAFIARAATASVRHEYGLDKRDGGGGQIAGSQHRFDR